MILYQRYKRRVESYLSLTKELSNESIDTKDTIINDDNRDLTNQSEGCSTSSIDEIETTRNRIKSTIPSHGSQCTNSSTIQDIEDLVKATDNDKTLRGTNELCNSTFTCSGQSRQQCQEIIRNYRQQQQHLEFLEFYNDTQSMRHTVVLILMICSMFVVCRIEKTQEKQVFIFFLLSLFLFQSISLSVWTLIMEGMSGIYIELSFFEAFLNFGQCILVSACFITDTDEFWKIIGKYWRKMNRFSSNVQSNRRRSTATEIKVENDAKTRIICEQFVRHHLNNCKAAIGSDRFAHSRLYKEAFYGTTFVNWLITVGLASDRREAVSFANYLIDGGLLQHINDVKNFYDRDIIYCFTS